MLDTKKQYLVLFDTLFFCIRFYFETARVSSATPFILAADIYFSLICRFTAMQMQLRFRTDV